MGIKNEMTSDTIARVLVLGTIIEGAEFAKFAVVGAAEPTGVPQLLQNFVFSAMGFPH